MNVSFAKGAMAAFKSISNLKCEITCKCDQTGDVLGVARDWSAKTS
jgi:hypothetical protein